MVERHLDPVQLRQAVRVLARLQRTLERAATDLTIPQYRVLSLVAAGGERSTRLAEQLAVRKPTLSAVVDGLVAAGHLERVAVPGDRRAQRLQLTAAGQQVRQRAEAACCAALEPLFLETGEPDRLLTLLAELGNVLDARSGARREALPGGSRS